MKENRLSISFNMALGSIPLVIAIILYLFIPQEQALYIATAAGVLFCLLQIKGKKKGLSRFILYGSTAVLLLFSGMSMLGINYCPRSLFPILLEVSGVIPSIFYLLNRKRLLAKELGQATDSLKSVALKRYYSSTISSLAIVVVAMVHFIFIALLRLIFGPLSPTMNLLFLQIAPPLVFVCSMVINQMVIKCYNDLAKDFIFVPIMNRAGDVLGRAELTNAIMHPESVIIPVVRIAIAWKGMIYLVPSREMATLRNRCIDLPMETFLRYGEGLEDGARRVMKRQFPHCSVKNLNFHFMYHYHNKYVNRLVYVFLNDLDDESELAAECVDGGKLWTMSQVDHNLEKGVFSSLFEMEYDYLKAIICTREKYKES